MPKLLQQGHINSESFKTSTTYVYQPISIDGTAKKCLQLFLSHFRPCAGSCLPNDLVFIKWQGKDPVSISRFVKKFFMKHANLNLTTTLIRTLVETMAENLLRMGQITPEDRKSVSNSSGHGSEVVRRHYVLWDRHVDADASRKVFRQARGIDAEEEEEVFEPVTEDNKHNDYGTDHLEYDNVRGKRITWSDDEVSYLTHWKAENVHSPDEPFQLRRCLQAIIADRDAHPIFHQHHLETTQRLRSGYEKA